MVPNGDKLNLIVADKSKGVRKEGRTGMMRNFSISNLMALSFFISCGFEIRRKGLAKLLPSVTWRKLF